MFQLVRSGLFGILDLIWYMVGNEKTSITAPDNTIDLEKIEITQLLPTG